jgi:multiple sugar transport system substrate-binding protein
MFHRDTGALARPHRTVSGLVAAVLGLATIAALGACAPDNSASGDVTLNYWTFMDFTQGVSGDLQKELIAEFEDQNPGIKVNLIGKDAGAIITGTVANAGQEDGPDVITTQMAAGSSLIYQGALVDLKERWDSAGADYTDQLNTVAMEIMSPDGHVWGIPYTQFAVVLYRNLTVLEQAGIDPADGIQDWADWLGQMELVHNSGNSGFANAFTAGTSNNLWVNYYAGADGATPFDLTDDGKATTLSVDALASALAFLKDTRQYGTDAHMDEQAEADLFTTNKLAFLPSGPRKDASLQDVADLKYDYVLLPGEVAGTYGGMRGGEFMAVTASSKNQDAAWKFVQFMTDAPNIAKFSAGIGRLVANDAAMIDPAVTKNPLNTLTFEAYKYATNEGPLITELPPNISNVFVNGMAEMDQPGADPKKIAQEMIDAFNKALQ